MAKNLNQNPSKGKNFLINDTFVRVDGTDWVNLQANIGKFRSINVVTAQNKFQIHRPLCEGYVVTPDKTISSNPILRKRCMTEAELTEARDDHYFLRPNHYINRTIWMEYWHSQNKFGMTHANQHIQAYNQALHEKRQQYARDHPETTTEDVIKNTYDEEQAKKLFNRRTLD